ncbi:hypothetical protein MYCTH_2295979 [Thermothelomyces thermophilus ATCC 42464]|uniref:Uncharacterized protein n=1 Tax=Thermothelomyces thermophilus (strain ATCC 42464 / BCRC 31852 / DSM 1799) TaxID=573729 RepID=G2PZW1_THET4|nr:uncharacterized protein MYCTH_2295979 [Thermothelomyces thermophilus ATCC 42464]AEO53984.1 hypothetical protein MYCTH_2295979 [Thermothelomyces thermophilus ATCC 42464]
MGLGKRNPQRPVQPNDRNAAVVLASRSLASWLDDDAFVARLLAASGMADVRSANVSVLTAAVDEVPRYDRRLDHFTSSEGISILRGNNRRILPFFPLSAAPSAPSPPRNNLGGSHPPPGSLEFRPPPKTVGGPQRVYVPLANTLFANGRPNTIAASQWWFPNQMRIGSQLPLLMQKVHLKEHTVVLPPDDLGFPEGSGSLVSARVVPVTPARKVLNSMGNILSKLEVDGKSVPASEELERIIPLLLKAPRKLRDGDHPPGGPFNVWALSIPPGYAHSRHILQPLQLANYSPDQEWSLAKLAAYRMNIHLACGCRLHKVVSGGGGWGAKQGLLSLDPQTEPLTDEDQDLQSFIDSFSRKYDDGSVDGGSGSGSGIAPPGWYVQFFVEAAYPEPQQYLIPEPRGYDPEERPRSVTTVFGTPGAVIGASPLDIVRSYPNLFGGVSSEGVYLVRRSKAQQALLAKEEKLARERLQLASQEEKEMTWEEVKAEEKRRAREEKEALRELQAWKTQAAEEDQPREEGRMTKGDQAREEEKQARDEEKEKEEEEEEKKEEEKKEEEKKEEEKKEEKEKEKEKEEKKEERKEEEDGQNKWIVSKMDTPRSYLLSQASPYAGVPLSPANRSPPPSAASKPRAPHAGRLTGRKPHVPQAKPSTGQRVTAHKSPRRTSTPRPRSQNRQQVGKANGSTQSL